jgi:hypothetical protein
MPVYGRLTRHPEAIVMTNKNGVFISYANEELQLAETLKKWINHIFPNCTTFISASYQSVGGGESWREKIKISISEARVSFCLLGPSTQNRPWIHFESGAAWVNGVKIVPILHLGLNDVPTTLNEARALYFTRL